MFREMGFTKEPMPDFDARYKDRLESCLAQPFSTFGGVTFYKGTLKKAVALFYYCIKSHPFENGNKRFAVAILMYFLIKNGYWMTISPEALYKIAKTVAKDKEIQSEEAISTLYDAFKPHLQKTDSLYEEAKTRGLIE